MIEEKSAKLLDKLRRTHLYDCLCGPEHGCGPGQSCGPDTRSMDGSWPSTKRAVDKLRSISLEITSKCNLNCLHCFANENGDSGDSELEYSAINAVLEECSKIGCRIIQFIGGEPLLHPNISNLLDYAYSLGFEKIELFTNGTLLDTEKLKMIKKCGISLAFSIYSDNRAIHDEITRCKGSYDRTIGNIRKAIEEGIRVRAVIIILDYNKETIGSTIDFLKKLGVDSIRIDEVRGYGRGKNIHKALSWRKYCRKCIQDKIYIDSRGRILPCVFTRHIKIGEINEGIRGIINGRKLEEFRRNALNGNFN